MTSQLINVSLMLLLTIGFFVALMFALKYLKRMGPKFSNSIEILGGASVSHKAKVVMIRSDDQKILIGVTDSQINTLHVFDEKKNSSFDDELTQASEEAQA